MGAEWVEAASRAADDETRRLFRATDWAATPLGPTDAWPAGLRSAVTLCLGTRFPALVTWGPELTMIYNSGYRALLGTDKHPDAWAAPLKAVWADVWADIEPFVRQVVQEGRPTWVVDQRLFTERSGFVEEATFTYSYSPLVDDDGTVRGLLDIAYETTEQVVGRRRLAAAANLSSVLSDPPRDVRALAGVVIDQLTVSPDVSAAAIHVRDDDDLRLVGAMPDALPVGVGDVLVQTVARSGVTMEIGTCMVLPLPDRRSDRPAGVLVLAGNPHRPWDDEHRAFLRLLAATVATALRRTLSVTREVRGLRQVADALQAVMLPDAADTPTLQTRYRPAEVELAVGGDWYDVVDLGDGRCALLVGDCVGHGLEAAALMGQLRSAGRALLLAGDGPAEAVRNLDRVARRLPGAECTTVLCAVVDPASGELRYTAAGHVPPLVVGPSGARYLQGGRSVPLGLTAEPRPEARTVLDPEDTLVVYTDGLVERRTEQLRAGFDRLARVSRSLLVGPLEGSVVDALLDRMLPGEQRDDVALLLYRLPARPTDA